MVRGRGRKQWGWFLCAAILGIGQSVVTQGALGRALVREEGAPLFRAVQTIRIFGKVQRIEAVLAAATLIGAFSAMLMGGEMLRTGIGNDKNMWCYLPPIAIGVGLESIYRCAGEGVQSVMEAVFWGVLTAYALWIVILEKTAKSA